jgi:hypothetical protein
LLKDSLKVCLAEWLWWGETGNLSPQFKRDLVAAEKRLEGLAAAEAEMELIKKRIERFKVKKTA